MVLFAAGGARSRRLRALLSVSGGGSGAKPREKIRFCAIESVSVSKTPTQDALEAVGFVALAGAVNVLSCFGFVVFLQWYDQSV